MKTTKLQIKDLILWDENARLPDKYFNTDEKILIKYFLSKPENKIKQLIKSIVNDIDLPQLEKLVVWKDDENNYFVIEGNRRLTAYKLLTNNSLTEDKKTLDFLNEVKDNISIDENFQLECIICENKEDALRYVDRKHANGNNEVNWGEPERLNYEFRRGKGNSSDIIKLEVTNIVKNMDLPEEMKDKILGKGYVTTFFRAITTTPAKHKYGYKIEDGKLTIDNKNFQEELKVIIYSILKKEDFSGNTIDSRTLNKTKHIETFIQSIKPEQTEKVFNEIESKKSENLFGETTINIGNKKASNNNIKSKPIPIGLFSASDLPFRIKSSSLRILYEELKNISVKEFPNASHDLLRSFLECSLIYYFKEINEFHFIQKKENHNPKLGEMLTHIINKKCKKITDENLIASIKQIKTDYDQPYSLERMNMINHNENWASSEKDVRKAWAKLESLFRIILS